MDENKSNEEGGFSRTTPLKPFQFFIRVNCVYNGLEIV
ncbi:hypothetical protein LEP1GSC060_3132 [Leptospira weilii serovar Ranarum str. ICFT]|uniref:Uncharacterized protein n=1 Tax=Leptospira weilii serovar Ranarum str. ICFT TaxID=1218598 RepID=N1WLV3_9LEPT|nr:hypothetical protein LEP1GSC060_3132 [Leptospira weilii serovar Ranarum str. ICFT]